MSYQSDTEQCNGQESETATLLQKLQEVKEDASFGSGFDRYGVDWAASGSGDDDSPHI
jgi:hypothetical protein